MISEFEMIWKEAGIPNSRYYPGNCLNGQRETIQKLEQPVSSLRSELGPPKFDIGMLTTWP